MKTGLMSTEACRVPRAPSCCGPRQLAPLTCGVTSSFCDQPAPANSSCWRRTIVLNMSRVALVCCGHHISSHLTSLQMKVVDGSANSVSVTVVRMCETYGVRRGHALAVDKITPVAPCWHAGGARMIHGCVYKCRVAAAVRVPPGLATGLVPVVALDCLEPAHVAVRVRQHPHVDHARGRIASGSTARRGRRASDPRLQLGAAAAGVRQQQHQQLQEHESWHLVPAAPESRDRAVLAAEARVAITPSDSVDPDFSLCSARSARAGHVRCAAACAPACNMLQGMWMCLALCHHAGHVVALRKTKVASILFLGGDQHGQSQCTENTDLYRTLLYL